MMMRWIWMIFYPSNGLFNDVSTVTQNPMLMA